jgi:hypothetical protein
MPVSFFSSDKAEPHFGGLSYPEGSGGTFPNRPEGDRFFFTAPDRDGKRGTIAPVSGNPYLKRGKRNRSAPAGNKREAYGGPSFFSSTRTCRTLSDKPGGGTDMVQNKEGGKLGKYNRNLRRIRVIHQEGDRPFGMNFRDFRGDFHKYLQIFNGFGRFAGFRYKAVLAVIVRVGENTGFLGKNRAEGGG